MTKNSQIKRSKLVIFKNTTNKKYMLYFTHYKKVCGFIKKISTSEYFNLHLKFNSESFVYCLLRHTKKV